MRRMGAWLVVALMLAGAGGCGRAPVYVAVTVGPITAVVLPAGYRLTQLRQAKPGVFVVGALGSGDRALSVTLDFSGHKPAHIATWLGYQAGQPVQADVAAPGGRYDLWIKGDTCVAVGHLYGGVVGVVGRAKYPDDVAFVLRHVQARAGPTAEH